MKATKTIANFVVESDYKRIPPKVKEISKNAILDCVGVTIAGSSEPVVNILAEQATKMGAVSEAGVICHNFRTSTDLAAWINGAASHVLDYDDASTKEAGFNLHPTVPVLAAVLALGEKYNSSGSDVLTAYAIGVEVEYKLGSVIGRYNTKLGWHPTPVLGVIGATAASAKILKLNIEQIRTALGIASSLAGGLTRNFGTMTKSLHVGNAAKGGVLAALLAKNGFTANKSLIEGEFGFCDLFTGGEVVEPINFKLGDSWDILTKGITFKPYPCCRATHQSIDAILHLRNKYKITPDKINTITCKTGAAVRQILRYDQPKSGLEAKFSMQYCIANALLKGKVSLEDFTSEEVNDASIQKLMPKIGYLHPGECDDEFSLIPELIVKLTDDTEYTFKVPVAKGDPANPLTEKELIYKFTDCANSHLSQNETEQVLDILSNLESLDYISRLMELLTYEANQSNSSMSTQV